VGILGGPYAFGATWFRVVSGMRAGCQLMAAVDDFQGVSLQLISCASRVSWVGMTRGCGLMCTCVCTAGCSVQQSGAWQGAQRQGE